MKFSTKLNKKGMSAAFIVGIIITLAAFIVLAFAFKSFAATAESKEAEQLCRSSLALKADTRIQAGPLEASTPILCKTIDEEFSADTKEKAMDQFAAKIERCWWQWLEGAKSEMFGPLGLFGENDDKTRCFVCYDLLYKEGPSFTEGEFLVYLKEKKAKKVTATYLDYVQKNGYFENFENTINSPGAYGIVFASNIVEGFWKGTGFLRLLGIYDVKYSRNGIWLISLSKLGEELPCYVQKDVAE